jgi:hypothetical protein
MWLGKRIRRRKNKDKRDYRFKLSLICDGFTNHESFKLDARFLLQDQTEGTKEASCTRKGAAADRTQQILESFQSVNPSSKDSYFPCFSISWSWRLSSISPLSPIWHDTKLGFVHVDITNDICGS